MHRSTIRKRPLRPALILLLPILGSISAARAEPGWKGWLAPGKWQAGIPPISLVALLAALTPLVVKRRLVHEKRER